MWIYYFIGYLAISSSVSYADAAPKANVTSKVQDKRQTDHQTRIIQIGNQRDYAQKGDSQHQAQQQIGQEEFPAEYLSLLQELQYQQAAQQQQAHAQPQQSHAQPQYFEQPIHAAPAPSRPQQQPTHQHQFSKPSGKQQKAANIQYHLPSAPTKEPQQQQQVVYSQSQHQPQTQEPKFQYISEEEYLQLIKQQEQEQAGGLTQYQTIGQRAGPVQQHHQQHQQRPAQHQKPKYRPAPVQAEHLQYIQPQQLEQYRQRPVASPLQQQPPQQQQYHFGPRPASIRPLSDSSFEKELQRLVDSNKPVHYEQRPIGVPQKANARQHHKQPSFYPESYAQPQPQPTQATRYVAPSVQKSQQVVQPSQKPKFESPASKYQLVVQPQPTVSEEVIYKSQSQPQPQHQPQFYFNQYPKPTGQPISPKVQFYTQSKEKQSHSHPRPQSQYPHQHQQRPEVQQQQQHFQEYVFPNQPLESQIYEAPASVMKIVDAPNLQYEKPTAAQLQQTKDFQKSASRPAQTQHQQYLKQTETIKQSSVPSKSQIYVSQTTGSPSVTTASPNYQEQQPQQYTRQEKNEKINIPLPDDRPLTQEEFQALVDAGFPVVPVPVPVPSTEYEKYSQNPHIIPQRANQGKQQSRRQSNRTPPARFSGSTRAPQTFNQRYQQQAEGSSHSLTYLRPLDHFKSGLHGPNRASA